MIVLSYLYYIAVLAAGGGEVQEAQERQSVFPGPPDFQLVRPADLAVVRPVASCGTQVDITHRGSHPVS